MRSQLLLVLFFTIFLAGCKTYLDVPERSFVTDYMTFRCGAAFNEFNYFSRINGSADKEIFYTTHFSIKLPKKVVYWMHYGNRFFFEYDAKQVICLYTAYKNEGKNSDSWELKSIKETGELTYLEDYWNERGYGGNISDIERRGRITRLFTNGKYKILLYNIKQRDFPRFLDFAKTYVVEN